MQALRRLLRFGQVTVPAAVITAIITLASSAVTAVVTFTIAEAHATAEFRAEVADHRRELKSLEGLPVEDLKKLPGRFEAYVAAAEAQGKTMERIEVLLRSSGAVRTAGGRRP